MACGSALGSAQAGNGLKVGHHPVGVTAMFRIGQSAKSPSLLVTSAFPTIPNCSGSTGFRENRGVLPPTLSLSRRIRENDRSLVADFRASSGRAAKVRREPECPRLGGCAGKLRRTSLPQNFPDIRENTGNFDQSCLTG